MSARQITLFFIALNTAIGIARAGPQGRYTAQLAAESDALLRCSIRRPYGWAWDHTAGSELTGRPSPRAVTMGPAGTPAAGLILLWAGRLLAEPRFTEAAAQVARSIAAAQMPTGRVLSQPVFGPIAGGREPLAIVADRAATEAAIGLLLASLDTPGDQPQPAAPGADDPRLEAIHRSAARCARWLVNQQSPNGLWPRAFPAGETTQKRSA